MYVFQYLDADDTCDIRRHVIRRAIRDSQMEHAESNVCVVALATASSAIYRDWIHFLAPTSTVPSSSLAGLFTRNYVNSDSVHVCTLSLKHVSIRASVSYLGYTLHKSN